MKTLLLITIITLLITIPLSARSFSELKEQLSANYDLVIANGRIIDGTGNPWFAGDIAIEGDRIVAIGRLGKVSARRYIDAQNKIVAPGFIDMLGQSELNLLVDPRAESKIFQGITTEITGEGRSAAPMNDHLRKVNGDFAKNYGVELNWHSFSDYLTLLQQKHMAINLGSYVGATQVRRYVLAEENRTANKAEMEQMKKLVAEAMEQGAFGVSSLLIFVPGIYANTDELVQLAQVSASYGGIYATHIRGEADTIMTALDEAIEIGQRAKIPVEVFHLKLGGRQNWGKMNLVIKKYQEARSAGLDISANLYPYLATNTLLSASIPPWVHEGGRDNLLTRLKDPTLRERIKDDIRPGYLKRGGGERILITNVGNATLTIYQGKRLPEIARMMKKEDELEALIELLIADQARTEAIYFSMNEEDLKLAMQQPWVSFCTDYEAIATTGPFQSQRAHPRAYGTFPRILGHYVREEQLLSLADAIRKMTSLPAQRMGLKDRGLLKPGMFADIVIFDADKIKDLATYEEPNQLAIGMHYVIINGSVVLDNGKQTQALPGRVLYGAGFQSKHSGQKH